MTKEVIESLQQALMCVRRIPYTVAGMSFLTLIVTLWQPLIGLVMALLIIVYMLLMFITISGSYIKISLNMYKEVQKEQDRTDTEKWREKMSAEEEAVE